MNHFLSIKNVQTNNSKKQASPSGQTSGARMPLKIPQGQGKVLEIPFWSIKRLSETSVLARVAQSREYNIYILRKLFSSWLPPPKGYKNVENHWLTLHDCMWQESVTCLYLKCDKKTREQPNNINFPPIKFQAFVQLPN